jgi:hypothetical protein
MSLSLDALLERAIRNPAEEPAFFRALLDAELFIHRPHDDDADLLRIVQFDRPDGLRVIPTFTDLAKARAASGAGVEIVALNGRVLFDATRGATLMINPNDNGCTLYPEEIADLLSGRPIAQAPVAGHATGVNVEQADESDLWIGRLAARAIEPSGLVTALYQLKGRVDGQARPAMTLLVIAVAQQHAERAAHAIGACLRNHADRVQVVVDLTAYDPREPLPDWLVPFADTPVWRRNAIH